MKTQPVVGKVLAAARLVRAYTALARMVSNASSCERAARQSRPVAVAGGSKPIPPVCEAINASISNWEQVRTELEAELAAETDPAVRAAIQATIDSINVVIAELEADYIAYGCGA